MENFSKCLKDFKKFLSESIFKGFDYFRQKNLVLFLVGIIVGGFLSFIVNPDVKSTSYWTLLGALLSFLIVLIYQNLLIIIEHLKNKTIMGKLLGPINYSKEKCVIFITELWRDIQKDPIYLYDKQTRVIGTSYLLGSGDSSALTFIYSLLMKAGKTNNDIMVIKSYERLKDYFDDNFISIGGKTNKSTEKIMEIFKNQIDYYFSQNGYLIFRDFGETKKYIESNDKEDFGILMKKTNINYPNKVIFIIAGISDLGTSAAAYYFFDKAKELVKEFGDKDFSLIIGVKRDFGEKSAYRFDFEKDARECKEGGNYE